MCPGAHRYGGAAHDFPKVFGHTLAITEARRCATSSQSSGGASELSFTDTIVATLVAVAGLASRDGLYGPFAGGLGLCGAAF